jgi:predicted AlkP superfamily pyrophosphatase or phosphodiesterase
MKRIGSLAWGYALLAVLLTGVVGPLSAVAQEVAPAAAQATARPSRPFPAIQRVVIISIDGLRPDLLIRARMPNVHQLMTSGAASFWARTTEMSVTLPSHVSMLTGVPPEKHGITWNDDRGNDKAVTVPTVFEIAKHAGYTTAMAAGKSKFAVLVKPGTLDALHLPSPGAHDDDLAVASAAGAMIKKTQPDLLMVHLPANDAAGHQFGWGSLAQIATLERADQAVGILLTALDEAAIRNTTLIILTADHGGQGRSHGPNDVRSRYIPWIATGPGIKQNFDLNLDSSTVINTEDTFATTLYVLGLTAPQPVTGKPVLGIFAAPAKLGATTQPTH